MQNQAFHLEVQHSTDISTAPFSFTPAHCSSTLLILILTIIQHTHFSLLFQITLDSRMNGGGKLEALLGKHSEQKEEREACIP